MTGDRKQLGEARRIVVKLGTNVVTHDGVELALGRLNALVEDVARLRKGGLDVVLVSSGAIGMGMRVLAVSCVTNMAAGILPKKIDHEEVLETGRRVRETLTLFMKTLLPKLANG